MSANQRSTPDPVRDGRTRSPEALATYRDRLTKGEDAIDPDRWSGSLPAASGVPPRIRIGSGRWFNLLWLLPIGFVLLIVAVAAAQGLRHVPAVDRFIARYPGTVVPASARAHPGLPVWVNVTHFLNLLLMVFIIRSGIQILADHPRLYTGTLSAAGALYGGDEVAPDGQLQTPEPRLTERLTERLVERALQTGARVSPIEGAAEGALKDAAGIGALLRW